MFQINVHIIKLMTATDAYEIGATEAGAGGYGTEPTGYGSYL